MKKTSMVRNVFTPDKYEFLVYRLLRNYLEAGDIYVSDSKRFRSFEDDLIPLKTWQANKEKS